MDDFVISNLHESRNEWCSRLVSIFTPVIIEGVRSIFNESWKMCLDNEEASKYLMTFQNLLSRVPKWNNIIVEEERKRIVERSGCDYLEDLITCVHIIQLKVLTCIRVGNKQKKIDISIPKLDIFIHKVYIHVARKVYMNVYLLERNISPLHVQKNNRELESIVQECILTTIRESVPTEAIIRAYMDEGVEQEEEVTIEDVPDNEEDNAKNEEDNAKNEQDKHSSAEETVPEIVPTIQNIDDNEVVTKLEFNDIDSVLNESNRVDEVSAPKSLERLEDISTSRAIARKLEEESDTDDERIQIHTDMIDLSGFDILDEPERGMATDDVILDGIEELPPI
tara:strand:- start:1694 stop:2707 length:1014 start_codon:yes stop_codon:yes gene_type:complete